MYLTIISQSDKNWNALVVQPCCIVTASSRDKLIKLTSQAIALALEESPVPSATVIPPDIQETLDGSEEIVYLEPAPINPVSRNLERVIQQANVSQSELARLMGVNRSAVSRLLNPFYWGHSVKAVYRVASALNQPISLEILP